MKAQMLVFYQQYKWLVDFTPPKSFYQFFTPFDKDYLSVRNVLVPIVLLQLLR